MTSLKENSDHIDHFLKTTQKGGIYNKYYTFFRDKRSVIMFTHLKGNSEKKFTHIDIDDLETPVSTPSDRTSQSSTTVVNLISP